MDNVKQAIGNVVNKVEEAVGVKSDVQVPAVPAPPAVPVQPVVGTEQPQVEVAPTPDRSAYNCPVCKGEGLLNENTKCPTCFGTGKVKV